MEFFLALVTCMKENIHCSICYSSFLRASMTAINEVIINSSNTTTELWNHNGFTLSWLRDGSLRAYPLPIPAQIALLKVASEIVWYASFVDSHEIDQRARRGDIKGIEARLNWLCENYNMKKIKSLAIPALGCGLGRLPPRIFCSKMWGRRDLNRQFQQTKALAPKRVQVSLTTAHISNKRWGTRSNICLEGPN